MTSSDLLNKGGKLIAMVSVVLLAACAGRMDTASEPSIPILDAAPLSLEDFHLFDLGVTDINADGMLDFFTTNHSARQSFMLADGKMTFGPNKLEEWGLSQSAQFPGLEDAAKAPPLTAPGVYIYWQESRLILQAYKIQETARVSGVATFLTPIVIDNGGEFDISVEKKPIKEGVERNLVSFSLVGDGKLIIEPQPFPRVGSPVSFSLEETTALEGVFVGVERVSPDSPEFSLGLKDRHGLAWADFNRDERPDLLSVRGGNLGLTSVLSEESVSDELFLSQGDVFRRVSVSEKGFEKRDCASASGRPGGCG